jgi:hypothetical protein
MPTSPPSKSPGTRQSGTGRRRARWRAGPAMTHRAGRSADHGTAAPSPQSIVPGSPERVGRGPVAGAAEVLLPGQISADTIRTTVHAVLAEPRYRTAAAALSDPTRVVAEPSSNCSSLACRRQRRPRHGVSGSITIDWRGRAPVSAPHDGYRVGAAAAFATVSEEPPAYASILRCSTLASSGRRRSLLVARRAVRCQSQIWHARRSHSSSTEGGALTTRSRCPRRRAHARRTVVLTPGG